MRNALDWVFPVRCAGCDAPGARWCGACDTDVGLRRVPLEIDGVWEGLSVAPYDGPVGRALRRAKYGPDRRLMTELGELFALHVAPVAHGLDGIVAVPSPWTRRLARGFSGAAVLACALGRRTGIPVLPALRLLPGARQAGLRGRERDRNLGGRMRSAAPATGRILLVDDVLTTGSTAAAAARELLGDSTRRVLVATLACATPEMSPCVTPGQG